MEAIVDNKIFDLIKNLNELPSEIILTPVKGKKPYKRDWTNLSISREEIEKELKAGKATGYAVKLGSNNLFAIDIDGHSANELFCCILVETGLTFPETVQWTSNKTPNHYTLLFKANNEQSKQLDEFVKTFKQIKTAENEQLELRWKNSCCVLPFSIHPDTNKPYEWKSSPQEQEVKIIDQILLENLLGLVKQKENIDDYSRVFLSTPKMEEIEILLQNIPLEKYDYYHSWISVIMALNNATSASDDGLVLADKWSQGAYSKNYNSPKYKGFDDIKKVWKSLDPKKTNSLTIRTLYWLAKNNGYKPNNKSDLKSLTKDELEKIISSGGIAIKETVERMNREYAVVQSMGNKTTILKINENNSSQDRPNFEFLSPTAISFWCKNRKTVIDHTSEGNPIYRNWFEIWSESPNRREFEAVKFAPRIDLPETMFNLFSGYMVQPERGDIKFFKEEHVYKIICREDPEIFKTVWEWLAHLFQKPYELPRIALVMTNTKQGLGKGMFLRPFQRILGAHYREETHMERVTGRFNGHLANCLLLNANEATWGGDKQKEGTLKALITDPVRTIEFKGKDSITLDNYTRLIVTSNESWPIPVGKDDRRFVVWTPSDKRKDDHKYFEKLNNYTNSASFLSALLHELLYEVDLSNYVPNNNIPVGNEHLELKIQSFQNNPIDAYFWDMFIVNGHNSAKRSTDNDTLEFYWEETATKDELHNTFMIWCEIHKRQNPATKDLFMRKIRHYMPDSVQENRPETKSRQRCLTNMNSITIREHFAKNILKANYETLSKYYAWNE